MGERGDFQAESGVPPCALADLAPSHSGLAPGGARGQEGARGTTHLPSTAREPASSERRRGAGGTHAGRPRSASHVGSPSSQEGCSERSRPPRMGGRWFQGLCHRRQWRPVMGKPRAQPPASLPGPVSTPDRPAERRCCAKPASRRHRGLSPCHTCTGGGPSGGPRRPRGGHVTRASHGRRKRQRPQGRKCAPPHVPRGPGHPPASAGASY